MEGGERGGEKGKREWGVGMQGCAITFAAALSGDRLGSEPLQIMDGHIGEQSVADLSKWRVRRVQSPKSSRIYSPLRRKRQKRQQSCLRNHTNAPLIKLI